MDDYLDNEEQRIVEDFEKALESGNLKSVPNLEARKKNYSKLLVTLLIRLGILTYV
ncbi:hypothetical protein M1512_00945 [Patescibacteria group bacterium]|nr:hypothetical protein [Patescibacteria group bacterium]